MVARLSGSDTEAAHPRRILLGAFGDPGHAFPMIALGRALAARGHEVTLQTWERWRAHVEAEGVRFAAAPEYHVFPNGPEPLDFYEAVVHATRDTLPLVRELKPEIVVADILTLAPALAAELQEVPVATLIPHVHPHPPAERPDLLDRRPPATHRARPRLLAARHAAGRARTGARPAGPQRRTGASWPAGARPRPRRHQPAAGAGGNLSPARVPARRGWLGSRANYPRGRPADLGAPHR